MSGYRPVNHRSLWQCSQSIFQLHNESVNILTHFVSAALFWYLSLCYYKKDKTPLAPFYSKGETTDATNSRRDSRVIATLCVSFASVFSASFVAHTFCSYSEAAEYVLFRIDWTMICVAMFGSCTTVAHFAFFHHPKRSIFWRNAFAGSCIFMAMVVNTSAFASLPTGLKTLGPLIPVPCIAGLLLSVATTLPKPESAKFLQVISGPIALSIFGLSVYGSQIPERWFPGRFDLTGGSHSFHHIWTTTYAIWMVRKSVQWSKWRNNVSIPK